MACTAAAAYNAAKRVESFPEVMDDLDKVTILQDDGHGNTVTRWDGTISVGPLTRKVGWTERDYWDDAHLSCSFQLVEGDMTKYDGDWTFTPNGETCLVRLRVEFELGIPLLGPLINRMVDQVMQANCDQLLQALEKLATK